MDLEEDLKSTAESDVNNSAKADYSRRRLEDLYRDRSKKRNKLLKKGRSDQDLEPWLCHNELSTLREGIRDFDEAHHRKIRKDRAIRNGKKDLKPIAVNQLKPCRIIDAWIPFVDSEEYKRRPAVVVNANKHDVEVLPITSSLGHRRLKTPIHVLEDWEEAGLPRPSGLQNRKVTIPRSDVLAVTGTLQGNDRSKFFSWTSGGTRGVVSIHQVAQASLNQAH